MKTAVLFYISHYDDWCVTNISQWARSVPDVAKISFCGPAASAVSDFPVIGRSIPTTFELLAALEEAAHLDDGTLADNLVFAFGDSPFYDPELTARLYDQHTRYAAEYSFADGYPQGLVPELICYGTVKILKSLAADGVIPAAANAAAAPVTRESLFNLLKTDINSFEIETLLAPVDWRSWRLDFTMATAEGRCICNRLRNLTASSADELCQLAVQDLTILHPVPAYYNIQIAGGCGGHHCIHCPYPSMAESCGCADMSLADFTAALDKMAAVSETAVVSVSLWGEPFTHPELAGFVAAVLSHSGFSVLIETSLSGFSPDTAEAVSRIPGSAGRITWICALDAASEETWNKIHPDASFSLAEAERRASYLSQLFPGHTYTQFIRMNENEHELESFYRSHENRLIQKYDGFCGILPDRKPADLSPVLRFPCWHLRRDMAILWNGDVPLCREHLAEGIIGNVFTDDIAEIWKKSEAYLKDHCTGNLSDMCRKCDEYYTYNF